jgi:hypothetical protein
MQSDVAILKGELAKYKATPHLDMASAVSGELSDPLEWWKKNRSSFPLIAKVAQKYLSVPATEASSERVFSVASNIITKRRNRLTPEHSEDLIFCHESLDLAQEWAAKHGLPPLDFGTLGR